MKGLVSLLSIGKAGINEHVLVDAATHAVQVRGCSLRLFNQWQEDRERLLTVTRLVPPANWSHIHTISKGYKRARLPTWKKRCPIPFLIYIRWVLVHSFRLHRLSINFCKIRLQILQHMIAKIHTQQFSISRRCRACLDANPGGFPYPWVFFPPWNKLSTFFTVCLGHRVGN